MKLVLVRHGESEWNKLNLFTGWTDVDLSEKGHAEAIQAGKLLKEEGYDFDRAEYFLAKAHKKFDDTFIGKKYLISAVIELSLKKGYEKVCDVIPQLSDNQVKRIIDAKSDDKIGIIKTMLQSQLDK